MNLVTLRKVIREEVRTVFREELQEVLTEAVRIASEPVNESYQQIETVQKPAKSTNMGITETSKVVNFNPIEKMLEETKLNFTSQDAKNFYGGTDVPNTKAAAMAHNMGMSGNFPGVDLGSLSFLKNAKNILDKSKEIDKDKSGGN